MSLWLALAAGFAFSGAALFEAVRPSRPNPVTLVVALAAAAAVAFSVAGLAKTRDHDPSSPARAPASYFDGNGSAYFNGGSVYAQQP